MKYITGLIGLISLITISSCEENKPANLQAENIDTLKTPEVADKFEFGIKVNDYKVVREHIDKNETFGQILLKHNIDYPTIHRLVKQSKDIYDVRRIQRDKSYTLICDDDSLSTARVMIYQPNMIDYVVFDMRDTLKVYSASKEVELREREVSGIINSSLSNALDNQGVDYRVSNSLSDIFAWTVDFFRIQKGDFFKLIYDEMYIDDTVYVGIGEIKAAQFYNNGESFYSFYYDNGETQEYFDENGKNLRKAFLKAPLKYGTFRISSRFGRRYHPVHHKWKVHLGIDYAAPTGTPIISTANGTVIKSGYTRANGNYVKIKHNSTYSTQYLHMSKRAVRAGQTVKQGQVIGYVGSTGYATGPHVCYRFWKNGQQVNALRQKLPDATPIKEEDKQDFFVKMKPLKARLDQMELPLNFEQKEVSDGEVLASKQ